MPDVQTMMDATFNHVVLRGTPYELGQMQAQMICGYPAAEEFFSSGRVANVGREWTKTRQLFARYCPGIYEEIQGFADGLHIAAEDVIYFATTHLQPRHCSHLAVLPGKTSDGHVLVGRNYDFGPSMDDLRLCSTYASGKYAHIGFSTMFFGRNDGLNQHGLSVTASTGGLPVGTQEGLRSPIQDGLQFWALIRTILETCRTVDEAVEVFRELPACGNPVLIFADRNGHIARAEAFGPHKSVKRLPEEGPEEHLIAANHFAAAELRALEGHEMANSRVRYQCVERHLGAAGDKADRAMLRCLLSSPYPNGLCCHYYQEFFGTLHALVFDITEGVVDVCFGSPAANAWQTFSFDDPLRPGVYPAHLPMENAPKGFWEMTSVTP